MIYTVHNTSASARVFYDARKMEVTIKPGDMRLIDLDDSTYTHLQMRQDIIIKPASFARHAPVTAAATSKPALSITGHFGIGDNLHQRAVMRELMKTHDVWLHTCHFELYHDLIEQGLKLIMRPTGLHAQARTIQREQRLFTEANFSAVPPHTKQLRIGYPKQLIDQHGSILESMFSCVGLKMPERPDFSLPIKPEWRKSIHDKFLSSQWRMGGRPLLIHRPIVVRKEWDGRSRNPDPAAYHELFQAIREQFFVVSIADLAHDREWIDGPQQNVDVELHKGELTFPEMAALFAEARMVYCNAGFAPVLAQAVGTPVIVVYGGRESYRTTQRVGAHLAPTLPIDTINPCDCHCNNHACDKRIDLPRALERLREFIDARRNTLLFGTFYVDSPDRNDLTDLWKQLHFALNERDCDFLAVDSQSPIRKFDEWHAYDGKRHHLMYWNFPDNIGHLSRPRVTQGRDGWGRAFCKGLEIACELGYDYVAHIEGDSLFRLKVLDVTRQMKAEGIDCASTDVHGMKNPNLDKQWIETGLMFFSTDYLKRSKFIERYDWPNRKVSPTPERYIRLYVLNELDDKKLRIMPWKALRADKNQITKDNILTQNLDWVTHQHDSAQQGVYQKFVEMALAKKEVVQNIVSGSGGTHGRRPDNVLPQPGAQLQSQVPLPKLNLGCGTNKLNGWENRDADVDITKRLPWDNNTVSYINIEHCVEHVSYRSAIEFFKEAHRVLSPGGVLRVTVPSLEQIAKCDEADYHRFTTKWQPLGPSKRGAMHAIIYAHGHETAWNAQLMRDTLYFAGFDDVRECPSGQSDDPVLRDVEGHGKVIGAKFNLIESCTHEARKSGHIEPKVAIVVGGAECWKQDLEEAKKLLNGQAVRYFYINDHISTFPEPGIACTLHPDKLDTLAGWLRIRRKNNLPEPEQVWAHRKHSDVTHDTGSLEWKGSSGLFAVQVARREGYRKIIGCGVPMTVDGGHFERHQKWQSAITFRAGWVQHKNEIAPHFRSMSGWTREQFGTATEEWLSSA